MQCRFAWTSGNQWAAAREATLSEIHWKDQT
jgi:hypothetical protein